MKGVITAKHVIIFLPLIVREFGVKIAFRCVWAVIINKRTTFLEEVMRE
jgi:hypothetical protein